MCREGNEEHSVRNDNDAHSPLGSDARLVRGVVQFVKFKNYGVETGVCVTADNEPVAGGEEGFCQVRGWCTTNHTLPFDPDNAPGLTQNVVNDVEQWPVAECLFPSLSVSRECPPTPPWFAV